MDPRPFIISYILHGRSKSPSAINAGLVGDHTNPPSGRISFRARTTIRHNFSGVFFIPFTEGQNPTGMLPMLNKISGTLPAFRRIITHRPEIGSFCNSGMRSRKARERKNPNPFTMHAIITSFHLQQRLTEIICSGIHNRTNVLSKKLCTHGILSVNREFAGFRRGCTIRFARKFG